MCCLGQICSGAETKSVGNVSMAMSGNDEHWLAGGDGFVVNFLAEMDVLDHHDLKKQQLT